MNPQPVNHKIQKIEYFASQCLGECPVFNITIEENRTAYLIAEKYCKINGKRKNGTFKVTLKPALYQELIDFLNYIDFENLWNYYAIETTDAASGTLEVTYDGKIKTIEDYGHCGTLGLRRLHYLFYELQKKQKWQVFMTDN